MLPKGLGLVTERIQGQTQHSNDTFSRCESANALLPAGVLFLLWTVVSKGVDCSLLGTGILGSRVLCWFDWLVALFWSAARTGLLSVEFP